METEASTGAWRREESERESKVREDRSSTEVAVAASHVSDAAEHVSLPVPVPVPVPVPDPQVVRLLPSRAERVDESHGGGVMRRESSRDDGDEVDDGELGG